MTLLRTAVMEYPEFRRLCFTSLKPKYSFICGSFAELPYKCFMFNPTDVDKMFYCYDICAIPWTRNPPKNFKGTVLRIDSATTPPGYARLLVIRDKEHNISTYFRRPPMLQVSKTLYGPSFENKCSIREPFKTENVKMSIDLVYSVYCPYWPMEAYEWKARQRKHGWPDENLIARIARGGCHFVSKLREEDSYDDTEWRFSFSKAEFLLIHSWTNHQKNVYHFLRLVKNDMVNYCSGEEHIFLQTYFFKTLMLWACEEKPCEYWTENTIEICVCEMLGRFLECLNSKCCPNYFIPDNNMMKHLENKPFLSNYILQILVRYIEKDVSNVISRNQIICAVPQLPIQLPRGYHFENFALSYLATILPLNKKLNGRLGHYLTESEWFLPEMEYLHRAIEANHYLMSFDGLSDKHQSEMSRFCLDSFNCALSEHRCIEQFNKLNTNLSLAENFNEVLKEMETLYSTPNGTKGTNRNECKPRQLVYQRWESDSKYLRSTRSLEENDGFRFSCRNRSIETDNLCEFNNTAKKTGFIDQLCKQFFANELVSQFIEGLEAEERLSPVPLFELAVAYRANFYFTCLKSYKLALQECEGYFNLLSMLKNMDRVCDRFLPMIFSTEFLSIYDEHIQTVIGFALLHKMCHSDFSDNRKRMKLNLALHAGEFLKYLKIQCKRRLLGTHKQFDYCLLECSDWVKPQMSQLPEVKSVGNVFFYAALRQSGANIRLRIN